MSADHPERDRRQRTATLSAREIAVVRLVAEGLTNDQIAEELVLSPRTVHSHVASAMRRTETTSRTQLAILALREGLAPLHPEPPGGAQRPGEVE